MLLKFLEKLEKFNLIIAALFEVFCRRGHILLNSKAGKLVRTCIVLWAMYEYGFWAVFWITTNFHLDRLFKRLARGI